jgi:hypothetical protein
MDYDHKAEDWKLKDHALRACVLLAVLALPLMPVQAAEGAGEGESEPKMISGISIVGNNEAPKSLFIVPWKSSEIGFETNLNSGMMDDSLRPVDKDVFMREIDFYEIRHAN